MARPVRKNAVGVRFDVRIVDQDNVAVDLTTATTKQILLQKPDGAVLTKTATLIGLNLLRYTTQGTDLDEAGLWHVQANIFIPGGYQGFVDDPTAFTVGANLG